MLQKKLSVLALAVAVSLVIGLTGSPQFAQARPTYKKEFDGLYVKKEPSTPEEKALAGAASTAKCNICHIGEKKKERNPYGQALAKLLTKEDAKDVPKIQESIKKIEAEKSDGSNPSSPTFGDLLKQGKLPAGDTK